ncbi:MAG: flagellar type III secretion system pore protein FliP [FCB group bacterium]|nr:flagellar type III secretion system pore protein FliP [FCB group bacterium]
MAYTSARRLLLAACVFLALFCAGGAYAQQTASPGTPGAVNIMRSIEQAAQPGQISTTLMVFLMITVLSLAPAILIMTTSFTRIIVVLGFLRQAMATQQTPSNQVLIGLALFLTFFIMAPTYQRVYDEAVQPYMEQEITQSEAVTKALAPIREFMFRQTDPSDIALFMRIAKLGRPNTPDDVPTNVLVPAYAISELRTAFQIGFLIYIPFLIIDMVVASTLMSMGMLMLPPVFVSLPFKIIMFVLADGWGLLISGLVRSFM